MPSKPTPTVPQLGPPLSPCLLPQAQRHVNDLYEDLRDGHNLISLLEVLSGDTLVRGLLRLLLGARWAVPLFPPALQRKQLKPLHRGPQRRATAPPASAALASCLWVALHLLPGCTLPAPCVAWPEPGV